MAKTRAGKTAAKGGSRVRTVPRDRGSKRGVERRGSDTLSRVRWTGRAKRGGVNGPIHASFLEDRVVADLLKRGIKYEYEPETLPFDSKIHGGKCRQCGSKDVAVTRRYTPDLKFGEHKPPIYVEVKGKFTASNRRRMEEFLADVRNTGFDLRFVFQRDNWITRKHKSRYSDWADEHKIPYAIGDKIPDSWLKELQEEPSHVE